MRWAPQLALVTLAARPFIPSLVLAQQDPQPERPTEATNDNEADHPSDSSGAATKIENALKRAQEKAEQGLTPDYKIEFGDTDDWLQLTTGEWVRGDLRMMHSKGIQSGENVKFYSEQFDDLTFSWSDVAQVHSPKMKSYTFRGQTEVTGKAMITRDKVIIETEEGVRTLPRSQLVSIIEGEARERSWWSTEFSLGFSANAGNSNQGSLNTTWSLQRTDGRTLAGLGYNGSVVWADGSLNANRHLIDFDANLLFWKRFYVIPVIGQLLYDEFQNLKLRATPAAGGGVHVFRKEKHKRKHTNSFEWDLQAALGYQFTRFFSTATGVANPQSDGFIMFRTYFKFEFISDDVEIEIDWRTNLVYTTIGNTNHNGTATVIIQITDMVDFQPSFLFLRTEEPQPESDGTVPKKNDYQLVVSIALQFG